MKSLHSKLKEFDISQELLNDIQKFETDYYETKNQILDIIEENELLQFNLNQVAQNHSLQLTDISKKLNKTQKNLGENETLKEIMLQRAKILDHFTMAYMAEMELKPSKIRLVTNVTDNGEIQMYFEKHSDIIMPGE